MFQNQKESLLITEPLIGYRSSVVRYADGALFSVSYSTLWPDGGLRAACLVHPDPPEAKCTCGIYCAKTLEWLAAQDHLWSDDLEYTGKQTSHFKVATAVQLWGKVQEYSDGYRAEWARPVVIYYTPKTYELCLKVSVKYNAVMEPRPELVTPLRKDDPAIQSAVQRLQQQQRDRAKARYLEQKKAKDALKAKLQQQGYMDAKGKWTLKADQYFAEEGGDA